MSHRNFGIRHHVDDFWNGSSQDYPPERRWPYVAIGIAVGVIVAIALLAG